MQTLFPDKAKSEFQADYSEYLASSVKRGNYFAVFRDHCRVMSFCEAALIGHLANVGKGNADRKGFILATPSFLANVGLDRDQQRDLVTALAHKRFIDVEMRDDGGRPRRFIRIRFDNIEQAIRKQRSSNP